MYYEANYTILYKTIQAFEQFLYLFQEISKPILMLCMDTTKFTKSGYIMSKAMDRNGYKASLNIKLYIKLVTEGLQLTDHH